MVSTTALKSLWVLARASWARSRSAASRMSVRTLLPPAPFGSSRIELISIREEPNRAGGKRVRTLILDAAERLRAQEARAKTQSDFKAVVDTIQGVVWEADPTTLELLY